MTHYIIINLLLPRKFVRRLQQGQIHMLNSILEIMNSQPILDAESGFLHTLT